MLCELGPAWGVRRWFIAGIIQGAGSLVVSACWGGHLDVCGFVARWSDEKWDS